MKRNTPKTPGSVTKKRGTTLIEVLLSAVILAIFAVATIHSLFYPRLWVVNSTLEQSAIHAAIADIERHLNEMDSIDFDQLEFNTDGWTFQKISEPPEKITDPDFNYLDDDLEYLKITAKIQYRDGQTVEVITYRSLEIPKRIRGDL